MVLLVLRVVRVSRRRGRRIYPFMVSRVPVSAILLTTYLIYVNSDTFSGPRRWPREPKPPLDVSFPGFQAKADSWSEFLMVDNGSQI